MTQPIAAEWTSDGSVQQRSVLDEKTQALACAATVKRDVREIEPFSRAAGDGGNGFLGGKPLALHQAPPQPLGTALGLNPANHTVLDPIRHRSYRPEPNMIRHARKPRQRHQFGERHG